MSTHPRLFSRLRLVSLPILKGRIANAHRSNRLIPVASISTCRQLRAAGPHYTTRQKQGPSPVKAQTLASPAEIQAWKDNVSARVRSNLEWWYMPLMHVLILRWSLGYGYPERFRIVYDVANWVTNGATMATIVGHFSNPTGRDYGYRRPVRPDVLYMLGDHLFHNVPAWSWLGLHVLNVAAAMGDRDASLRLCKWEYAQQHEESDRFEASSYAREVVAEMATEGTNWQAMTMHTRHLLQAGERSKALDMAKALCMSIEPGTASVDESDDTYYLPLPWKTWAEALDGTDAEEYQRAWEYGAVVWDDPQACIKHATSQNVRQGTDHWVEYATKGAMAGDARLMDDLGRYYLALHGWYPNKRPVSKAATSKVGFAWLELYTKVVEPGVAATVWAGMALLLREHGDKRSGRDYLIAGLRQIESKAAHENKDAALAALRELLDTWEGETIVEAWEVTTKAYNQERVLSSSEYLGPPIIPVLQ